jgi:hypothetical protein
MISATAAAGDPDGGVSEGVSGTAARVFDAASTHLTVARSTRKHYLLFVRHNP